MVPSSSDDLQKMSSSLEPSAPPQPPPPPSTPLPSHFENTNTAAGIPVIMTNRNNPPRPPTSPNFPPHSLVPWSTGLCDCCDDISSCCLTCWCPCITFGRIAEVVDRGSTSCGVSGALYMLIMCVTGCSCLYSCFYRSKLRGQYFLKESPCTDCCVHCCCEECALCQEYRELKNQGYSDMSIGWHGNMERRKRRVNVPPSAQDGMNRKN